MYERPPAAMRTSVVADAAVDDAPRRPDEVTEPPVAPRAEWTPYLPSGLPFGVAGAGLVAGLVVATRGFGYEGLAPIVFPTVGVLGAVAYGRRAARVHPDEPWVPRLLLLGLVAKLVASYLRYVTLTTAYGGVGDATVYDEVGRKFVASWVGDDPGPQLDHLRQSNFLRWLTGAVYYLFGQNLLGAFLLFSLLAVVGSYFWYRAVARAVPFVDRRLFLVFVLFAPSVVFWPSSLGKEALMQLAVGGTAWATALLLTGRFYRAVPLMAGAGWLLWVVRPHLLALVAAAGAVPYFLGRVRRGERGSFLHRPLGMLVVGALVVLAVTAGASFLGIEDLSIDAIEAQLDEQTERTAQGGSSFEHGENSLHPLNLPWGLITVLFRPFPWETLSGLQLLAALESVAVLGLIFARFGSLRTAVQQARRHPFLLYCFVSLVLYGMTFSSFANFGLLNRQRSLVLPALYAIIAVDPNRLRTQPSRDGEQDLSADEGQLARREGRRAEEPRLDRVTGSGHVG